MDTPFLISIEKSFKWSEALVIIRGYRCEAHPTDELKEKWRWSLRRAGWKGAIYYLWWDSSNDSLINTVRSIQHWQQVKNRAKRVGRKYLPSLISCIPEKSVSLIGYSLGAYVVYSAMLSWHSSSKLLNNSILVGGAISRNKTWEKIAPNLGGQLINFYNSQDPALWAAYRAGELIFASSPCGLKPIKRFHPKITNINVTALVGLSHSELNYLPAMQEILGKRLWAC